MADDLVPAAIRNGGTGSVQVGGIRGPDYRQVQSAEEVNAQGVFRAADAAGEAAAARARALGGLFKEFEGISSDIGTKAALQAGALAGAASGNTGHPQYKQGLARFTAYGNAFNNAATGAYAIEAEAQADADAARDRVAANNNPATFAATYTARRDAVLKAAPADAVPMLTELYNKHLAANIAAITGDQLQQQRQEQRQIYDVGVQRQTSKVANFQGQGTPESFAAAEDEHVKLNLLIDGGVANGFYSQAEGDAMKVNAMRTITKQVFETQVDRELANPAGDPIGLLERFREAHEANLSDKNAVPVLSEDEFNGLMMNAKQKILQQNMMDAYAKRQGKTAEELKFEAGDKEYTHRLVSRTLTMKDIDTGVLAGDLKPELARSLRNALLADANGLPTRTTGAALHKLVTNPNFLSMSTEDILSTPGISMEDARTAFSEQRKRNAGWENTQEVKNAQKGIDTALKLPAGPERSMASPEDLKASDVAHQEFYRLMQLEDPAKRDSMAQQHAQEAVQHVQRQLAGDRITSLSNARQNFIRDFGPGSAGNMDKERFEARLKQYDDQIASNRAIASGK